MGIHICKLQIFYLFMSVFYSVYFIKSRSFLRILFYSFWTAIKIKLQIDQPYILALVVIQVSKAGQNSPSQFAKLQFVGSLDGSTLCTSKTGQSVSPSISSLSAPSVISEIKICSTWDSPKKFYSDSKYTTSLLNLKMTLLEQNCAPVAINQFKPRNTSWSSWLIT